MLSRLRASAGATKRGVLGIAQDSLEPIAGIDVIPHETIGTSVQGNPIRCFSFGDGDCHIAFVSATHGNEVGTVKLGHRIVRWLENDHSAFPSLRFSIVPCLNPDGYALAKTSPNYFGGGRIGRFNGNNVDLNRNFDTPTFQSDAHWNFGKDYLETRPVFAGASGGSEPETQALTSYLTRQDVDVLFMFHSVGRDVMGNEIPLSKTLVDTYAQTSGFNICPTDHWRQLGQTGVPGEWCEKRDIAFLEIELPSRWGSDFRNQKQAILSCLKILG